MWKKLVQLYQEGKSLRELAEIFGTNHVSVRNALVKAGCELRDSSEAQTMRLKQHPEIHPTKGKKHSDATKLKISETLQKELKGNEYNREVSRKNGRDYWANMTDEKREETRKNAHLKFREAAKNGSKLERYLVSSLKIAGHEVEFHREFDGVMVDIFLPKLSVAILVDGPSHYEPIFGEQQLQCRQAADEYNNQILLSYGYMIVRIRHPRKTVNLLKGRQLLDQLLDVINNIKLKTIVKLEAS